METKGSNNPPVAFRPGDQGHLPRTIAPAWVNDEILKVLAEKYDVRLIGTPEEDTRKMMGEG